MVGLCLPKDNDVVTDVECTGDISELVLNGLLKNLTGRVSAKIESSVPPESLVCCECGDIDSRELVTTDGNQLEGLAWRTQ